MNDKVIDITGQRFGRWTALYPSSRDRYGTVRWMCRCDCGTVREVHGPNLRNGKSKSCGCFARKISKDIHTVHGMYGTHFYLKWASMISRCKNPNHSAYRDYGGRGIQVCDRWLYFENFKDDLYESYLEHVGKYGEKETTLDRIDVNGNYEPGNVRWATLSEQARNKRRIIVDDSSYEGVNFSNKSGKWEVTIGINGKRYYLGSYESHRKAMYIRKKVENIIYDLEEHFNELLSNIR